MLSTKISGRCKGYEVIANELRSEFKAVARKPGAEPIRSKGASAKEAYDNVIAEILAEWGKTWKEKHKADVLKMGVEYKGVRNAESFRVTHCRRCKRDLTLDAEHECCACEWLICPECLACGCGWNGR